MNCLFVYADQPHELNCSIFNAFNPTKAINKLEGNKATAININQFIQNNEDTQKLCMEADIIILERNFFQDLTVLVQFWKVRGKTVIGIFDDAYHIMDARNVSYFFWTNGEIKYKDVEGVEHVGYMEPKPLVQFKWTLRMLKGIQVVSKALANDWKDYTKTYHVNNYLDFDRYQATEPLIKRDDDYTIIGWCGSLSHLPSFQDSGVLRSLSKICKRYPKVRILIAGDKRVFDSLEVPAGRKFFQQFVPDEQYSALLKTLDIGLAPLSGEYDKRRSWLKVLEYQAMKIPWVASNYVTYEELFPYGTTSENKYDAWEHALTNVLDHYADHKEKANTIAYNFALSQSIDNKIQSTLDLYAKIIKMPYQDQ